MSSAREPLSIFGAGGLGKEILSWLRLSPEWEPVGFFDDAIDKGTIVKGLQVQGGAEDLRKPGRKTNLIIAIGDPQVKQRVFESLREFQHLNFPAVVHPGARLEDASGIVIDAGSVVTSGCILTTDIRVGMHVLINLACTIGHDTTLGDFTSIMPGASIAGNVSIGRGVMIGAGAIVNNGVSVGDGSRVGAGAVVVSDVSPGSTVVGVPARPIQKK